MKWVLLGLNYQLLKVEKGILNSFREAWLENIVFIWMGIGQDFSHYFLLQCITPLTPVFFLFRAQILLANFQRRAQKSTCYKYRNRNSWKCQNIDKLVAKRPFLQLNKKNQDASCWGLLNYWSIIGCHTIWVFPKKNSLFIHRFPAIKWDANFFFDTVVFRVRQVGQTEIRMCLHIKYRKKYIFI